MDDKQDFTQGSIFKKMIQFMFPILGALFQCMASFVAQNVGAGKKDRAKQGMLYGMAVGCGIGLAAPAATVFGIALCFIYYKKTEKEPVK